MKFYVVFKVKTPPLEDYSIFFLLRRSESERKTQTGGYAIPSVTLHYTSSVMVCVTYRYLPRRRGASFHYNKRNQF